MFKTLFCTALVLATGIASAQDAGPQRGARHAEMQVKAEARFAAADKDNNGRIDRTEAQAVGERLAKNFERVDANSDGEISRDELKAMHGKMRHHGRKAGRRMGYMQGLMKGMDDDGNGAISRAELGNKVPMMVENFAAIDTDGNNELSREEMRAFHQARRAERRAQKAE